MRGAVSPHSYQLLKKDEGTGCARTFFVTSQEISNYCKQTNFDIKCSTFRHNKQDENISYYFQFYSNVPEKSMFFGCASLIDA